jgi:hypothetical protein
VVRDGASQDHWATIASLRREIPPQGVEDILVDGTSWNRVESKDQPGGTWQRSTSADSIPVIANRPPGHEGGHHTIPPRTAGPAPSRLRRIYDADNNATRATQGHGAAPA